MDATITWRRSLLEPECPPFPVLEPKYLRHLDPRLSAAISIREELIGQYNQAALKCWQSFLQPVTGLPDSSKFPAQFILSIHDETWFMVPEKYAEQFAVVFQMAHLYSWARFQAACGMADVPLSRAFFSGVAIDDRLRKSPNECTVTPSNPNGSDEPDGEGVLYE